MLKVICPGCAGSGKHVYGEEGNCPCCAGQGIQWVWYQLPQLYHPYQPYWPTYPTWSATVTSRGVS